MRCSSVGWLFDDEESVLEEAKKSAEITHNHPEGIKGAQAVALGVMMGRKGSSKIEIEDKLESLFDYDLNQKLSHIRPNYSFDVTCQGSVPQAIIAFWNQKILKMQLEMQFLLEEMRTLRLA